ncbi:class I SAM-dependent methyltransferase [Nocardia sp. NPDC049149]|uniref:class I SAM-dependent methyltransferase n=1 Tax=Nocardia sp. NPDC049149 TaxID=3364315 RepID=UPI003721A67D
MINPFDAEVIARRYVRGRLYYHSQALRIALRQLRIDRVGVAVDIACGTGLSTRAVLDVADRVVACDASAAMVHAAERHPRAQFITATAEQIPVRDAAADLATVAAAFHWFDQPKVLSELARVLRPGGGLVVYSDYFDGHLLHRPEFADWFRSEYTSRYPSVRRGPHFDPEAATTAGFGPTTRADQQWHVPLTSEAMAAYLVSQSNMVAATDDHVDPHRAMTAEIAPFFPENTPATAVFTLRVCTTHLRVPPDRS